MDKMAVSRKGFIKLHLGAFDQSLPGWINTDVTPHIFVSKIPMVPLLMRKLNLMDDVRYQQHKQGVFSKLRHMDLTKPLAIKSETTEAVFSSHVFEHLFIDEVLRLVQEIKRILIPGGVCRVVVPDLEKLLTVFDPQDPSEFLKGVFEATSRSGIKNHHHTGFTGPYLKKIFSESGFSKTSLCSYKKGLCPDVEKLDNRPEESIFFEAVK